MADGALEQLEFGGDIFGGLFRHQFQTGRRLHDESGADADARHARNALETRFALVAAGARNQPLDVAHHFRVGDASGDLRRQGDQKRHLFLFVAAQFPILHHENADDLAHVDDGHA